jgi:hypothetical protein
MATRRLFSAIVATLALTLLLPRAAEAAPVKLNIKVIHAHNKDKKIDPRLKKLAKQFASLRFTAFDLKDEANFNLEIGASGSMQLPGGEWMKINTKALWEDKLRLELVVDKLKFKSTVVIADGATLAVGGPAFDDGSLILAVSRPKPEP